MPSPFDVTVVELVELPNWSTSGLAAIGSSLLRVGDLVNGRRVILWTLKLTSDEFYPKPWEQPWARGITASVKGGDNVGAMTIIHGLSEPSMRALGLIVMGEAKVQVGDSDEALKLFETAVAASGEPGVGMSSTSLFDIGIGAAQTGNLVAAHLIGVRLGDGWLGHHLKDVIIKQKEEQRWRTDSADPSRDWSREKGRFRPGPIATSQRQSDYKLQQVERLVVDTQFLIEARQPDSGQSTLAEATRVARTIVGPKSRSRALWGIASVYRAINGWQSALDVVDRIPILWMRATLFLQIVEDIIQSGDVAGAVSATEHAENWSLTDDIGNNNKLASIFLTLASTFSDLNFKDVTLRYCDLAWQAVCILSEISRERKEAQRNVVIALADAGCIKEAIHRYMEAAREQPQAR